MVNTGTLQCKFIKKEFKSNSIRLTVECNGAEIMVHIIDREVVNYLINIGKVNLHVLLTTYLGTVDGITSTIVSKIEVL